MVLNNIKHNLNLEFKFFFTYFDRINKHLPNIPSAEEVAEEGIDLGDMQKLMMEKIEELTLYIIEQEKRIQELETQLLENE